MYLQAVADMCLRSTSSVNVSIATSAWASLTSTTALDAWAGITTSYGAIGVFRLVCTILVGRQTLRSVSSIGSVAEA